MTALVFARASFYSYRELSSMTAASNRFRLLMIANLFQPAAALGFCIASSVDALGIRLICDLSCRQEVR
jgi:hypothetical protein